MGFTTRWKEFFKPNIIRERPRPLALERLTKISAKWPPPPPVKSLEEGRKEMVDSNWPRGKADMSGNMYDMINTSYARTYEINSLNTSISFRTTDVPGQGVSSSGILQRPDESAEQVIGEKSKLAKIEALLDEGEDVDLLIKKLEASKKMKNKKKKEKSIVTRALEL
jgi:hypothetical protein